VHKIALVTLRNYKEWTESLGPRREDKIQQIQAELHGEVWRAFTSIGALPHHFRYDVMVALVNNVENRLVEKAVEKIAAKSPVDVDYCVGTGHTPYDAYLNCGVVNNLDNSYAVVAHLDIVNSTHTTKNKGPLYVYIEILDLLNILYNKCNKFGCMSFYLGGDNIMIYLSTPDDIYNVVAELETSVRAGVGVAEKPFDAFVKATRALDYLRSVDKVGVEVVR
jgi:GTP cyclohydrolase IIa